MFRLRKEKSDKLLKVKIGNIDDKKGIFQLLCLKVRIK